MNPNHSDLDTPTPQLLHPTSAASVLPYQHCMPVFGVNAVFCLHVAAELALQLTATTTPCERFDSFVSCQRSS
jgi:hypothetical protein